MKFEEESAVTTDPPTVTTAGLVIAGARVERDDEFLEVELTSGEDLQLRALSLGAARGWELALRHAATS